MSLQNVSLLAEARVRPALAVVATNAEAVKSAPRSTMIEGRNRMSFLSSRVVRDRNALLRARLGPTEKPPGAENTAAQAGTRRGVAALSSRAPSSARRRDRVPVRSRDLAPQSRRGRRRRGHDRDAGGRARHPT